MESDDDEDGGNSDNEDGEGDDDRHTRMLQDLTGIPSAAFQGTDSKDLRLFFL